MKQGSFRIGAKRRLNFSAVLVKVRRYDAFLVRAFAVVDGYSAGCRRLAGADRAAATALLSHRSVGEPSRPLDSIRRSVPSQLSTVDNDSLTDVPPAGRVPVDLHQCRLGGA